MLQQVIRGAWTFFFGLWFVASSAVFFTFNLALFLVSFPFDHNGRLLHLSTCVWGQSYFFLNPFWSCRIEGRERVPTKGAAVLVSNHESLADILVIHGLYRPFKWVSKASIFHVPVVGWNMYLNRYVYLVRGDKQSIASMMAACEYWLARGVAVMICPEGTRSFTGEMGPFKDGAFRLAIAKGCPLVPMVLTGTRDILPKHAHLLAPRADVRLRVLEPIDPKPFGGDVGRMRDTVRARMITERRRLLEEQKGETSGPARATGG